MKRYFVMTDGRRCGPFTLDQLPEAGVRPDTYVWCKGMDEWERARDVGDVSRFYRRYIYDLMHPSVQLPEQPHDEAAAAKEESPSALTTRLGAWLNDDGAPLTVNPEPEPDSTTPPPSLLVPAVLAAIMCNPLTGVVAIYYAMHTSRLWKKGEHKRAYEALRHAKMWIGITFFMGFLTAAALARFAGIL